MITLDEGFDLLEIIISRTRRSDSEYALPYFLYMLVKLMKIE